jgi:hypothetical protein
MTRALETQPVTRLPEAESQPQSSTRYPQEQRRGAGMVPPIVHEALRLPGQPLDTETRTFVEHRLGHDFSSVRVHTDGKAAASARALNALAYTVGRNIVFESGQYSGHTSAGRDLLTHELVHVVQQESDSQSGLPDSITDRADASEREADAITKQVINGQPPRRVERRRARGLMRRLRVHEWEEMIPNPTGRERDQTNAETAEGYLRRLSPQGGVTVDRSSGEVSTDRGFCPGFLGGLIQGARSGYRIGHRIGSIGGRVPLLGPIIGAIGGFFGALIGGIGGLFGAGTSPAASSQTPTGSTCICDFLAADDIDMVIEINDTSGPAGGIAGNQGRAVVPSPNSRREYHSATVSGQLPAAEPWLILGHELCGHAWLDLQGSGDEGEGYQGVAGAYSSSPEGQASIPSRDFLGTASETTKRRAVPTSWQNRRTGKPDPRRAWNRCSRLAVAGSLLWRDVLA